MWARSFRGRVSRDSVVPVAELPEALDRDDDALQREIRRLVAENRAQGSADRERLLLHLRNLLGIKWLQEPAAGGGNPERDGSGLPPGPLVEVSRDALTPSSLRAAILGGGCLLVRGLVDGERAESLAGEIDRAFAER